MRRSTDRPDSLELFRSAESAKNGDQAFENLRKYAALHKGEYKWMAYWSDMLCRVAGECEKIPFSANEQTLKGLIGDYFTQPVQVMRLPREGLTAFSCIDRLYSSLYWWAPNRARIRARVLDGRRPRRANPWRSLVSWLLQTYSVTRLVRGVAVCLVIAILIQEYDHVADFFHLSLSFTSLTADSVVSLVIAFCLFIPDHPQPALSWCCSLFNN